MLGSSVFANGGPWLSVGQVNAATSHPCPQSIRRAVGLSHGRHTIATWSRLLSLQLSCVQLFVTPWTATHQASCPLSAPGAYSNSCPSSRWCHPTTSSSVVPFFSCLQSLPASGSFPMSQFFTSSGQSIGASALASVLPVNIQGWFPLGLTGLISLQSKRVLRVFSNITALKNQFFRAQPSLWSNSHIHAWLLEKP